MIHVADSSKKTPFRPLYRAFYPDPANKSVLRAEGTSRVRTPGNRGWPLSVAPGQRTRFVFVLDPAWVRHKSQYSNN